MMAPENFVISSIKMCGWKQYSDAGHVNAHAGVETRSLRAPVKYQYPVY